MIPCLDKGYVELLSASPTGKQMVHIVNVVRKGAVGPQLLKIPMVYFNVKAPLFVIMTMGNIRYITDANQTGECYLPNIDDVGCTDIDTSKDIVESMSSTIEAGEINREMYVKDGCNRFLAQVTSTVATYWRGMMYADLETWCNFFSQKHAPHQIRVYQKAVEDLLRVEYQDLDDYIRRSR